MKILLLGHRGYLGSYIFENLDVDILPNRGVYYNGREYDYIIDCIGIPNLEYCELNELESQYSNCDVILDIKKYYKNSKIINFSSYYVYDSFGLCSEESNVTDKYNYTKHNLLGEKINYNGINFRVGKLFGHKDLDKQNKLTEYIIKNDNITLDNIKFNPTSLEQILKVILFEIKNGVLCGTYNISNTGVVSHYDYGVYINKLLTTNKKIEFVEKVNKNFHNYGNFIMTNDKISRFLVLDDWKVDLTKYIQSL